MSFLGTPIMDWYFLHAGDGNDSDGGGSSVHVTDDSASEDGSDGGFAIVQARKDLPPAAAASTTVAGDVPATTMEPAAVAVPQPTPPGFFKVVSYGEAFSASSSSFAEGGGDVNDDGDMATHEELESAVSPCEEVSEVVASGDMEEEEEEGFGEAGEEDTEKSSEEEEMGSSGSEEEDSESCYDSYEFYDTETSGDEEDDEEDTGTSGDDEDDDEAESSSEEDEDKNIEASRLEDEEESSSEDDEEDSSETSGDDEEEDDAESSSEDDDEDISDTSDDDDDDESSSEEDDEDISDTSDDDNDDEISSEEEEEDISDTSNDDDDDESSSEEEDDTETSGSEEEEEDESSDGEDSETSGDEEDSETSGDDDDGEIYRILCAKARSLKDGEIHSKDCFDFELPATKYSTNEAKESAANGKVPPAALFARRSYEDIDESDEDDDTHGYIDVVTSPGMCTHNAEQAKIQKESLQSLRPRYEHVDTDSDMEESKRSEFVRRSYEDVDSGSDMEVAVNVSYAPNTEPRASRVQTPLTEFFFDRPPQAYWPQVFLPQYSGCVYLSFDGIDSDSDTEGSDCDSYSSQSEDSCGEEEDDMDGFEVEEDSCGEEEDGMTDCSEEEDIDDCIDSGDEEEESNDEVVCYVRFLYNGSAVADSCDEEEDDTMNFSEEEDSEGCIDSSDEEEEIDDEVVCNIRFLYDGSAGAAIPRVPAESCARAAEDQFLARAAAERERQVRRLAAALQELDRALAKHAASSADALESMLQGRRAAGERRPAVPTANLSFCVVVYLLVYLAIICLCCL